jgi:RNA polymerase sigma-70 factor (ECF subfamily)
MHHFEDISYKEIAEMMKTSLSSVESLIFRALTSLKKRCSDFIEFEETVTKEIIK